MASLASHKAARSCRLMRRRRRKRGITGNGSVCPELSKEGHRKVAISSHNHALPESCSECTCTHEQEFSRPTPWLLAHPRSLAADPQGVGPFCRPLRRLAESAPYIRRYGSLSHYPSTQRLQGRGDGPERRNPAHKDVAN